MPEYTATLVQNLLPPHEWVVHVRYVAGSVGTRRRFRSFTLVPDSQSQPFADVCRDVEAAIGLHAAGRGTAQVQP